MYTYKYNFVNKGVIANHKNILAYILCIKVVDHRDVTVDELVYLASEFAGDGEIGVNSGYTTYLESLMKIWNALNSIDPPELEPGRKPASYSGIHLTGNNDVQVIPVQAK